jgi:hypothetical protein
MAGKKKFTIKEDKKSFNISSKTKRFKVGSSEEEPQERDYAYKKGMFNLDSLVVRRTNKASINKAAKGVNTVFKVNRDGVTEYSGSLFMLSLNSSQYYEVIKRGRTSTPKLEFECVLEEYGSVIFVLDTMNIEVDDPKKLVEELMVEQDPAETIVREVGIWLTELLQEGRVDYLADFNRYKTRLQRGIADKATKIGIKLNITNLHLKHDLNTEKVYNIENGFTKVQLKNLNDFVEVRYSGSICPNKAQSIYAIRNRNKKNEIPNKITNYLKTILRQYDFGDLYEKELSELVDDFKEEINTMMEDEKLGWQLNDFVIEFKDRDIDIPEYHLMENEEIIVHIRGEKKSLPIKVYNTLALNLKEDGAKKAKSNRKKTQDLDKWLKKLMSKVIHNSLMGVSYADLLINRLQYETLIREGLKNETDKIGYSVSNFMTIPDVEDGKLGNIFHFETDKEKEYHTEIGDIAKLHVIVQKVKIKDLESIRPFLQHDVNIKDEMQKLVEQTVTNFLHDKAPDDYYIHFDQELKEDLQEEIRKTLEEEFDVDRDVVKIISKRIKTPLIERLDALKGLYVFEFESFGQLKYTIHFKVNSIDPNGWVKFKELPFRNTEEQMNAIKEHLKGFLEEGINSNLEIAMKSVKHPTYLKVIKRFFSEAIKHIKNKFGLNIEFTLVKRHKTSAEELYEKNELANLEIKQKLISQRKAVALKIAENKTNRYSKLLTDLEKAIDREEHNEVERIQKELDTIEKETYNFDKLEDEIAELESEVDDTLDKFLENDDLLLLN